MSLMSKWDKKVKVRSEESDDLERCQEKIDERSRFRELREKSK